MSRGIFCVKLGESATVTYEKLQRAYGEHSLSRAQVFRWHKSFLEGREQVEDEPRAGKLSTSKTEDNVRSDQRLTLRMISSELNLNRFTVHQILTQDLGMDAAPRQRPMLHGSLHQLIFGRKKSIPVVPQPPYSPDLSPCDLFLFPRLKNHLKGRHYSYMYNRYIS
jgi:hypothetical protein